MLYGLNWRKALGPILLFGQMQVALATSQYILQSAVACRCSLCSDWHRNDAKMLTSYLLKAVEPVNLSLSITV